METKRVCGRCGRPVSGSRCTTCGARIEGSDATPGTPTPSVNPEQPKRERPTPPPRPTEQARPDAASKPTSGPAPATGSGPAPAAGPAPSPAAGPAPAPPPRPTASDPRLRAIDDEMLRVQQEVERLQEGIGTARAALGRQLGEVAADVKAAQTTIASALHSEENSLTSALEEQRATAGRAAKALKTHLNGQLLERFTKLYDVATQLQAQAAAGPDLTLTKDNLCPGLQVRELARVGSLLFPQTSQNLPGLPEVPAYLPLVNRGHIVVAADGGDEGCQAILTALVGQAFLAAPGGQMVVTVFDPLMRDTLGSFAAHGAATDAKILTKVHPSAQDLEKALGEHIQHMLSVNDSKAKQYATMADLVSATGQHEHQYRVLVLLDFPMYCSQRSAQDLERIIAQGAASGVSVIVHYDPAVQVPRDVIPERLLAGAAQVIQASPGEWKLALPGETGSARVQPLAMPPLDAVRHEMQLVADAAATGTLPKVSFREMVESGTHWWDGGESLSSAGGMQIALGKKGNQQIGFTLGDTVSNLHNVLVGGRAGSGKTVLLKAMIYSLALRYPPDELRLFLLDFKEGVEFQQFLGLAEDEDPEKSDLHRALPHVDVLSTESDAEFGLAVLAHFYKELKRRSEVFKKVGVKDIQGYRAKRPDELMPRWVLLIDEFHGMFGGATFQRASKAVQALVRLGRSYGLHVVLASQTISGIRFEGDSNKAIFENIPARLLLQIGPDEAKKFLQVGNEGASLLRYRGQAILNKAAGDPSSNELFVVAFAEKQEYEELQATLAGAARQSGSVLTRRPRVYSGNDYTSGAALLKTGRPKVDEDGALPAWFGQQADVEAHPATSWLSMTTGGNTIVLGSENPDAAVATVQTMVLSAVAAHPGLDIHLLNGLSPKKSELARVAEWVQLLTAAGANVMPWDPNNLEELAEAMKDAAGMTDLRGLFVFLGADNWDLAPAFGRGEWSALTSKLPAAGMNLVGYWAEPKNVPGNGMNIVGEFKTQLFVGATEQQIKDAAKVPRDEVPPLGPTRTLARLPGGDGRMLSVSTIRRLKNADFAAWREALGC